MLQFDNWQEIYDYLLHSPNGEILTFDRNIELPECFQETKIGFPEGCDKQYRDHLEKNSLHARVYWNRVEIHMDRTNPRYNPVGHFIDDFAQIVTSPTFIKGAVITLLTGFTAKAISSNNNSQT